MSDSDDERMRRLQELADNEQPTMLDFGEAPGPFELPRCGPLISAYLLAGGETFVLELETEGRRQRVRIPISGLALRALEMQVQGLRQSYGVGETRN